jgi:putative transposase
MKENKGKELLKILQENYEIETAQDLSSAIKDLFKDSLQEMMNAEFDSSMGYKKYDKKMDKTNYRNGVIKKKLKSEFGEIETVNLSHKLYQRIKEMFQALKIK